SAHVGADYHHGHLELFYRPFGLIRRRFWILQRERGSTEIACRLPTGGNRFGQPVVILARGLHGHLGVSPVEHVRGVKDQHLPVDALLIEVLQAAVQIPRRSYVDGWLVRSGCLALWRRKIDAGSVKLHQMPAVREQFDLEWTIFQPFKDTDVTININDLHRVLLTAVFS